MKEARDPRWSGVPGGPVLCATGRDVPYGFFARPLCHHRHSARADKKATRIRGNQASRVRLGGKLGSR